jgi:hypothetical protein
MKSSHAGHYGRFFVMLGISFMAMFILMYAMVDSLGNVHANVNQIYMAALMTAPMAVLEVLLMSGMYDNRRLNAAIIAVSLAVLVGAYGFIRKQTFVSDEQFLRSMIPHHAGAILMCGQSSLSDSEIQALCKNIKSSQQAEISQMKAILARLNR